jgi:hypothetical protein
VNVAATDRNRSLGWKATTTLAATTAFRTGAIRIAGAQDAQPPQFLEHGTLEVALSSLQEGEELPSIQIINPSTDTAVTSCSISPDSYSP